MRILGSYRYNVIAANGNTFIGNFRVVASDGSIGDIERGKDGKGIKSIVTRYMASNRSSGMGFETVWNNGSVTPPTLTAAQPYMWQQSKTTYTDNTYILTPPVMFGTLGKTAQYINIIAECATEDYNSDNNTGHRYVSNVYMDGKLLAQGSVRGHTMLVVDPTTKSVINTYQFDTYDNATTAVDNLINAIDNTANDQIIIITSHDATSCNQNLRDKLSNDYNSNIPSNAEVWTSERYSHAIIIFKHSNREHQCFEQFYHFKPSYLTVYYTSDNMSLAGKDGNNGIMDKLSMTKARATVNINDNLYVFNEGYVNHIDGDKVTRVSDLSKYYIKLIDSNGSSKNASSSGNIFWFNSLWQSKYSEQTDRITHFRLQLYDTSDNLLDEITYNVTFDAGAVLTVGQNAITSSVQQSKTYTDGQISTVKQTADGIASRVTKIEGDYVTESEMNQTANNISLNVYDNLKNKTGIDVTTGKIVLDADNVQVKGNFNLTDTSNGLTINDAANTPLINLQPTPISKIGTFKNDRLMTINLTMVSVSGGSSIVVQTNKSSAISLKKGDVIRLSNIRYTIYASDGTTIYPRDINLVGGVRIYNGKGETVLNSSAQFSRNNNYGTYQLNTSVTYRTTADDNYTVNLFITTPSTWSTSYTVSGYGNTRIETGNNVQSYIGSDGAFFHNAPNMMIYSAEDELRLQFGYNGIRWSNDTEYYNKAMEVLCNVKSNTDGTYSPLYLPFYNFTPVTQSFTFKYQRVVNIASNKYAHNIMPSTDKGILLLDTPATDSNGNYQETWFVLPSESFGSRDGKIYFSLPIGYTVKIINNTGGKANVFVTPSASNKNEGVIYTSENAKVNYLKLTSDNSMKTFMYIGGYGTETTWRVID